jgi:hypothetical protein
MMLLFFYPTLLILAFLVGYAIRRGTVCSVHATRALIVDRRIGRFRAFSVAAAGSGAVIIPLHWAMPDIATLSPGYPVTWAVVLAGSAFGIGARINGACALGTLAHLTGGNMNYALTVTGMVIGAVTMSIVDVAKGKGTALQPSPLEEPTVGGVLFMISLAFILFTALYRRVPRWWRAIRDPSGMRMGPYRAMLVVGICGGLLYTLAGSWTYMNVLSQRAARLVDPSLNPNGWPASLCAVVLVAGGITAALRTQDLKLQALNKRVAFRCLSGGVIMGASAAVIPGGNGTMLIHGLPSLAPHAIAAFIAMTVVLCLSFVIRKPQNL